MTSEQNRVLVELEEKIIKNRLEGKDTSWIETEEELIDLKHALIKELNIKEYSTYEGTRIDVHDYSNKIRYIIMENAEILESPMDTEKQGGCYVATCVYGSYDCPPVWTLRRFRDDILAYNVFGRLFIRFYYATSPTAVRLFGKQKWFHKLFKTPLDKFVKKLQENGVENTPYND